MHKPDLSMTPLTSSAPQREPMTAAAAVSPSERKSYASLAFPLAFPLAWPLAWPLASAGSSLETRVISSLPQRPPSDSTFSERATYEATGGWELRRG